MFFLIYEGQIASPPLPEAPNAPPEFGVLEGPDLPNEMLYYKDGKIHKKSDRPSLNHFWNPETNEWFTPESGASPNNPEAPAQEPQWDAAVGEFQYPGNTLYTCVWKKVKAAGDDAKDHWSNFKTMMVTPNLRSVEVLRASIGHLENLLADAGHPLTQKDKKLWNELMDKYSFDESTHL